MRYPLVEFVALNGRKLALALGFASGLLAAVLSTLVGAGPVLVTVLAVLAAGVVWGGSRLVAEIVELIAETKLPD